MDHPSLSKAILKYLQVYMDHIMYVVLNIISYFYITSEISLYFQVNLRSQVIHDRAIINFQFSMAAFSTSERRKRTKGDRYYLFCLVTTYEYVFF